MSTPKRKNNIKVYNRYLNSNGLESVARRIELAEEIKKSDSYLPDSIKHDDLDLGMLDFVRNKFKITSDGEEVPVMPKILTIQKWSEYHNNWTFSDDDGNIKLPFIAVIRKPDVQFGTNPAIQRTIPNRREFFYQSVPTWDGNQLGADIYKIPQPIAVDLNFDVTIICNKFRDLNSFNNIILRTFSSRQTYTTIKGHYIPIVLERIEDKTPMQTIDNRRFYVQNYTFTMLGFIMDEEEFEVVPAFSRQVLMMETDVRSIISKNKKVNTINISCTHENGSIVVGCTATSTYKVDKTLEITFTDKINTTTGSTIDLPVTIVMDMNSLSGSTQYNISGNYNDLSLTNIISDIKINPIGRSKYNYNYSVTSNFISPTPSVTPSLTPSVTPSISVTPTPSPSI